MLGLFRPFSGHLWTCPSSLTIHPPAFVHSLWSLYQQALSYPVSAAKKDAEKGGLLQGVKEGMKGEALGEGIKGCTHFLALSILFGVPGTPHAPQGQWSASRFQFTLRSERFCLQRSRFVQSQGSGGGVGV